MDLGHLGFFELDDVLPILLPTRNGSLVPSAATGSPAFTSYNSAGTSVHTASFGASDHDSKTGLRFLGETLSAANGYGTGKFTFWASYVVSGTTYGVTGSFTIV